METAVDQNQMTMSLEERNDLRRRVLAGYQMTTAEAKAVFETLRQQRATSAALAAEDKPKRGGKAKKAGVSDQELDNSLAKFGL